MPLLPRKTPTISSVTSLHDIEELMPPASDALGQVGPREYEFFRSCDSVSFDATQVAYSPAVAWYLSDLSYLVYADHATPADVELAITPALTRMFRSKPAIKVFLGAAKRWGKTDENDKIQCVVAHDPTMALVAFRGTLPRSLPNWLTDADYVLVPEPGPDDMHVHQGFQGALDCLWQSGHPAGLQHYLTELHASAPDVPLWFTGHSLGAALATMAVRRFGHAHALYTFGSPKVGDAAFVARVAESTLAHHRVVNHRDIFTGLPYSWRFEHSGLLTEIAEYVPMRSSFAHVRRRLPRSLRAKPGVNAVLRKCFDDASRLKHNIEERLLLRAVLDHVPIFYSKILWNRLVAGE